MIALALLIALAPVRVGSKQFTESVLLAELARQTLAESGVPAVHRRELGGTRVLWEALLAGQIDVYPEYTGTLVQEILSGAAGPLDEALRARGVQAGAPLGFEDTYAIGVRRDAAARLGSGRVRAAHPHRRAARRHRDHPRGRSRPRCWHWPCKGSSTCSAARWCRRACADPHGPQAMDRRGSYFGSVVGTSLRWRRPHRAAPLRLGVGGGDTRPDGPSAALNRPQAPSPHTGAAALKSSVRSDEVPESFSLTLCERWCKKDFGVEQEALLAHIPTLVDHQAKPG